jgi:uncharacterized protein (TIGR02452 family)
MDILERRIKNTRIFEDTQERYEQDGILKAVIEVSIQKQKLIFENYRVKIPKFYLPRKTRVTVSVKRTLEAAMPYVKQGKRVCVLNFASATTPGGGVLTGSGAQEESICRCSTLYPCLRLEEMQRAFYEPHRKSNNSLYNDDCIYTPDVCVFKSDTDFPEILPREEWWKVNVLTCAAPNLKGRFSSSPVHIEDPANDITEVGLEKLLTARIRRIFEVAIAERNQVLILGAFGCGAFKNSPEMVARVFRNVMQEYRNRLDVIEFAVFYVGEERTNFTTFS